MSYWADRLAASQLKVSTKTQKQIDTQMRKYYKGAAQKVMADFEATLDKLAATVEAGREPTPADLYKLDTYWQMQAQMRKELQKLGERQVALLTKNFERQFFEIYYSISLQGESAFNTVNVEGARQMINQIWAADGKSWSARIWENTDQLMETLNEQLIYCVAAGKNSSALKNLLQERFNVSYSKADALVRTELSNIQTQAAKKRYEDYGIQYVEILADEDERRCEICGKLHEKRYPIGAAIPIPAHPRCRCCIIPVIDDE